MPGICFAAVLVPRDVPCTGLSGQVGEGIRHVHVVGGYAFVFGGRVAAGVRMPVRERKCFLEAIDDTYQEASRGSSPEGH